MKKIKKLFLQDNERFFNFLIIAVLIIAFLIRLPGIFSNLIGNIRLYVNVDESGILKSAFDIIRTADFNPHNFTYPSLLIYLEVFFQAAVYIISIGTSIFIKPFEGTIFPDAHIYAMGRLLNVILGTITILVLYKLVNQILNRRIAIIAAAIFTVTFTHIWSSQYAVTDVPVTLLGLLSIFFSIQIFKQDRWRNYLLTAVFIGLAIGTKYNAFTFVVPLVVAHSLRKWQDSHQEFSFQFWKNFFNRKLIICLILIPLIYLITTPYTIFDIKNFIHDYSAVVISNSQPLNMQLTDADGIPSWLWYIIYSATSGLYYPIFLTVVFGLIGTIFRLTKEKLIILSYVVVNYFVISQMSGRMDRWILHIYPYLSIFAAVFIYDLGSFLLKKRTIVLSYINYSLFILILVAIFGLSLLRAGLYDTAILQKDTRVQATYWIAENIPSNKYIFSVDNAYSLEYLQGLKFTNLHGGVVLGDRALTEILTTKGERYIVFQTGYVNALTNYQASQKQLLPYYDSQTFQELYVNYKFLTQKAKLVKEISNPYFKSGFFGPSYLEQSSTVSFWHNPTVQIYYLSE